MAVHRKAEKFRPSLAPSHTPRMESHTGLGRASNSYTPVLPVMLLAIEPLIQSLTPTLNMPSLEAVLAHLNLAQYFEILVDNGFDSWEIVQDITEDDLAELGFKLGHRRALQRAIANSSRPSLALDHEATSGRSASPPSTNQHRNEEHKVSKRRYRRHPRVDPSAPKRPKTAYVMFADHLRKDPEITTLSFIEISRQVGMRWQSMGREEKYLWDIQAAQAMQRYTREMEEYRKTDAFRDHQRYLEQFRAKYLDLPVESPEALPQRPRLEHSAGSSSSNSSAQSTNPTSPDDGNVGSNRGTPVLKSIEGLSDEYSERRSGSRSSIHALLQAAEESDRIKGPSADAEYVYTGMG
ncbi:MAG: hypothetical protein M1820_009182 [Bogoriella megaspora]|nr:MAG: hypothetical protein M1820_009182 [Bogoriella megaspora]